jgi:hypothetical protein
VEDVAHVNGVAFLLQQRMRQHTSAYVGIRRHTSRGGCCARRWRRLPAAADGAGTQFTGVTSTKVLALLHRARRWRRLASAADASAYVSSRQHASAYVSKRQVEDVAHVARVAFLLQREQQLPLATAAVRAQESNCSLNRH